MDDIYCFGGNPLDRASERRNDREWIAALLADPETRILALRDLKPLTRDTAVPALAWPAVGPWRDQIATGAPLIFLRLGHGRAPFASDSTRANGGSPVATKMSRAPALAPAHA